MSRTRTHTQEAPQPQHARTGYARTDLYDGLNPKLDRDARISGVSRNGWLTNRSRQETVLEGARASAIAAPTQPRATAEPLRADATRRDGEDGRGARHGVGCCCGPSEAG